MVSAQLRHGPGRRTAVIEGVRAFLLENEYQSLGQMRGNMNLARGPDPAAYERADYMEILQSWHGSSKAPCPGEGSRGNVRHARASAREASMIRQIHIENFKSIEKLAIDLGRINVFIGENGCGKSNILEGIAFGTAAARRMLDNEFLASRGIRVTEPRFMRAAFRQDTEEGDIRIGWKSDGEEDFEFVLKTVGSGTQRRWAEVINRARAKRLLEKLSKTENVLEFSNETSDNFLIYAPENAALRNFQAEGQILPLGSKGEGLFAHLRALAGAENRAYFDEIVKSLSLIDWFDHFDLPANLSPGERTIHIRDRYLAEGALFDQRSANEGFLFLLFYFTLFISPDTPSFFAVDNVDTSLNPKLCAELLKHLARLAAAHGKQAILTTHNPAVLDGLDLHDDMQRLFVIHRASRGPTRARRILPPKPIGDELPMKLSAAFLAGHIGGLPKNF